MSLPPSGSQVVLERGRTRAVVVEVGGGLRELTVGGAQVLDGYPETEMCSDARGLPLVPWPNRLADGRWRFDGLSGELPEDEPAHGCALHGLARHLSWTASERTAARVVMSVVIWPRRQWPFTLAVSVEYALTDDGIAVTTRVRNEGAQPAPWACGQHPYLTVGTELVDDAELLLPAQTRLPTDSRQLPTGREPVAGTAYDFRSARRIGDLHLDYAFTDLVRGADGLARLMLRDPVGGRAGRGRRVRLSRGVHRRHRGRPGPGPARARGRADDRTAQRPAERHRRRTAGARRHPPGPLGAHGPRLVTSSVSASTVRQLRAVTGPPRARGSRASVARPAPSA